MHERKLLIHALDSLWSKYQKRLTDCHHEAGEETVHKLRIITRRLLALIALLQSLAPHPALQKLRKNIKTQLDAFDELRDTQVMLLEISTSIATLPELRPFLLHLQLTERRLLAQTPAIVENVDDHKLQQRLKEVQKHLTHALGKTHLKAPILAIIDNTYRAAMERYQVIDPNQPATIHRLRIAVKKLRYMLESGQVLLPPLPDNHIKQLHAYLTSMGEIQDSNVLLLKLKAFFGSQMPASIESHYQNRHNIILSTFISRREEIRQFWRQSPNLPLPWEAPTL